MIAGSAPASRLAGYERTLLSYTHGEGRLSQELLCYSPCPEAASVVEESGYLWELDGESGAAVESVPATMSTLPTDADQYLFSDTKGLVGSVTGGGTATYAEEVFRGHRMIGGTDGGRNMSSASLSDAYVKSGLTAPLCQLGRTFTVEACVNAAPPNTGVSVVLGAETTGGTSTWRTLLGSDGALRLEITLSTGAVVEKTIAASGFAGTPRHLAVTADLAARLFKVYVDRELALTVDDSSLYMPLVDGPALVVGGGCGGSTLDGRVDEVRVSREMLESGDFERVIKSGLMIYCR